MKQTREQIRERLLREPLQADLMRIDYEDESGLWIWAEVFFNGQGPLMHARYASVPDAIVVLYEYVGGEEPLAFERLRDGDGKPLLVTIKGRVRIKRLTKKGEPFMTDPDNRLSVHWDFRRGVAIVRRTVGGECRFEHTSPVSLAQAFSLALTEDPSPAVSWDEVPFVNIDAAFDDRLSRI